jgi:hypothetical protein
MEGNVTAPWSRVMEGKVTAPWSRVDGGNGDSSMEQG